MYIPTLLPREFWKCECSLGKYKEDISCGNAVVGEDSVPLYISELLQISDSVVYEREISFVCVTKER